jgi:hypothetical protein
MRRPHRQQAQRGGTAADPGADPAAPSQRGTPHLSALHPCECGCGALVRRRIAPGHAAKLRAQRKREERALVQFLV